MKILNKRELQQIAINHSIDVNLKGAPYGLRPFLASENPLKKTENAFYFTLKALLVLKELIFCLDFLFI